MGISSSSSSNTMNYDPSHSSKLSDIESQHTSIELPFRTSLTKYNSTSGSSLSGPSSPYLSTSSSSSSDLKLSLVKDQIKTTLGIQRDNITKVIERGVKLEDLQDASLRMEYSALRFHEGSKKLKRQMCIQRLKWSIGIGLLVIILLYFILTCACGGLALDTCHS